MLFQQKVIEGLPRTWGQTGYMFTSVNFHTTLFYRHSELLVGYRGERQERYRPWNKCGCE